MLLVGGSPVGQGTEVAPWRVPAVVFGMKPASALWAFQDNVAPRGYVALTQSFLGDVFDFSRRRLEKRRLQKTSSRRRFFLLDDVFWDSFCGSARSFFWGLLGRLFDVC